jgi:hypothetical protein
MTPLHVFSAIVAEMFPPSRAQQSGVPVVRFLTLVSRDT